VVCGDEKEDEYPITIYKSQGEGMGIVLAGTISTLLPLGSTIILDDTADFREFFVHHFLCLLQHHFTEHKRDGAKGSWVSKSGHLYSMYNKNVSTGTL
jgi:hypothetical protein